MEQQNTNFIKLGDSAWTPNVDSGNIFNELWGDLDFGTVKQDSATAEKAGWTEVWYKISNACMIFCIVLAIILTIDVTIKGSEDASFLSAIPGCEYIATYGIDQYENPGCLTAIWLKNELAKKTEELETKIVDNLTELLSLRFQLVDIIARPDVRFIQERSSDARVNIVDMLKAFEEIKRSSDQNYGSAITCQPTLADEKGNLQVTCDTYGDRIDSTNSITSRLVAGMLIDKLQESTIASKTREFTSWFALLETPKSLELSQFTSIDSVYSTKTTLQLKLKYISNQKL